MRHDHGLAPDVDPDLIHPRHGLCHGLEIVGVESRVAEKGRSEAHPAGKDVGHGEAAHIPPDLDLFG
jgi:hypothetical protein